MPSIQDLELATTGHKIINELCKVKPGESVLITIDSASEWKPAEEIAKAAEVAGANVMVAWHSTPAGYGKVADPRLADGLKAAIPNTDVWIELNNQWLLYSSPWLEAMNGTRVRYLFLGGLDTDQFVRCIGKIDIPAQHAFQSELVSMTRSAKHMRITNPSGTDVSFENDPERPVTNELFADVPGAHFLIGQIGWAPVEESINGAIVFDGSFSGGGEADLGILKDPVKLTVKEGIITGIEGGAEAAKVKDWLERLGDEKMYHMAHVCYGYNPGARLSGLCTEDERVWGSTEWGIGFQGPFFKGKVGTAATHADGICLNSSVWIDGEMIVEEGRVVHPKLARLAAGLGK
ncbi:MAG: leucyl aminopeptidase [Bacillota bacterium]